MKKDEALDHKPMEFGKYKGRTPSEIADFDPGYIVWLYNSIDPKRCSRLLADACEEDLNDTSSILSDWSDFQDLTDDVSDDND